MVCPRCITSVKHLLDELHLSYSNIELGKVELLEQPKNAFVNQLKNGLSALGFELLTNKKAQLISEIKIQIINQIHYSNKKLKTTFSAYLESSLGHEYSYLSKLFSSVEGQTIERFILKQKTERIKEYITYDQLTLSEISDLMGYSSVAYLSAQFRKETGLSPSEFRKLGNSKRQTIDSY